MARLLRLAAHREAAGGNDHHLRTEVAVPKLLPCRPLQVQTLLFGRSPGLLAVSRFPLRRFLRCRFLFLCFLRLRFPFSLFSAPTPVSVSLIYPPPPVSVSPLSPPRPRFLSGPPGPRQFTGRGPFLRRHLVRQGIALGRRPGAAPPGGEVEPFVRLDIILRHAQPRGVGPAQRQHCAAVVRASPQPSIAPRPGHGARRPRRAGPLCSPPAPYRRTTASARHKSLLAGTCGRSSSRPFFFPPAIDRLHPDQFLHFAC